MNKTTAEAFVLHFAQKYFSYLLPREVLDALNTKESTDTKKQNQTESNPIIDWENRISIQSHWQGVIEDKESDRERSIAEIVKQALFHNKKLDVNTVEERSFSFNPFGIAVRNEKFFLVGSYENSLTPCLISLAKIVNVNLTDENSIPPKKDFDLNSFSETYLNHPTEPKIIDTLIVEFPNKAYFYVKSHPLKCDELILSEPTGTLGYFTLTAKKVKNTFLLHQWLSSFHDDAQVLNPPFIRYQINRSFVDKLTNLYNRQAFERLGTREIDRYYRDHNSYFSILVMDIDHFKNINDLHGHLFGDEVLINVSNCLRDYDAIRYGGEEFVILLPNTHAFEAKRAAERIRENIESLTLKNKENALVPVTISIGIAEFPTHLPDKNLINLHGKENHKTDEKVKNSLMLLITEQADKALYQAKQKGRNKSFIFSKE